ncbi:MAG: hypothetical protein LM582_09855 [Desulfurococcaceae archaeon]|nr:hypothetical protein [Desulfurococcaceae archaeon]MCC6058477.1 hypothetical protein [Desulfurococcaceae archaeon]
MGSINTLKIVYVAINIIVTAVLYIVTLYIMLVVYVFAMVTYNIACFVIRITFSKLPWRIKLEFVVIYLKLELSIAWETISIHKIGDLFKESYILKQLYSFNLFKYL